MKILVISKFPFLINRHVFLNLLLIDSYSKPTLLFYSSEKKKETCALKATVHKRFACFAPCVKLLLCKTATGFGLSPCVCTLFTRFFQSFNLILFC